MPKEKPFTIILFAENGDKVEIERYIEKRIIIIKETVGTTTIKHEFNTADEALNWLTNWSKKGGN